jgi:hypothetical protein
MPKGTLTADFSEFYEACQKASVVLHGFEADAGKVEKSLNRLTNSFSGTRIQQEATLMAEAVERAGGAARLTEKEMARVNATIAEAIAKYAALGQEAPAALVELEQQTRKTADATAGLDDGLAKTSTAAGGTASAIGSMSTGLKTADKALGAMGVSIGPAINAFDEMTAVAGKSVKEVGAFGLATSTLAAGLAGWKAGRMIAEFFDLDKAIGDATAKLLGFGDVAGEVAGAKADTLARATKNAGREITDYNEAIKINEAAVQSHNKALDTGAQRLRTWEGELAKVRRAGNLGALQKEIEAGNSTVAEMARQFDISERAIDLFTKRLGEDKTAQKEAAAATAEHTKALEALRDRMFGTGAIKAATDYVAALGPVSNLSRLSADETQRLNTALDAAAEAYKRNGQVAPEVMRAIYVATLPIPPVVEGLGTALAGLGAKIDINRTAYADLTAEANRSTAAFQAAQDAQFKANEAAIAGAGAAANETKKVTAANQELAASYALVTRSAAEWQARAALAEYDAQRNLLSGSALGNQMALFQTQQAADYRRQAGQAAYRENVLQSAAGGGAWGGPGGGWTVNVQATNNLNGDQIAQALVDGMRRRGISPGGF